jgi:hypothetical protein
MCSIDGGMGSAHSSAGFIAAMEPHGCTQAIHPYLRQDDKSAAVTMCTFT